MEGKQSEWNRLASMPPIVLRLFPLNLKAVLNSERCADDRIANPAINTSKRLTDGISPRGRYNLHPSPLIRSGKGRAGAVHREIKPWFEGVRDDEGAAPFRKPVGVNSPPLPSLFVSTVTWEIRCELFFTYVSQNDFLFYRIKYGISMSFERMDVTLASGFLSWVIRRLMVIFANDCFLDWFQAHDYE